MGKSTRTGWSPRANSCGPGGARGGKDRVLGNETRPPGVEELLWPAVRTQPACNGLEGEGRGDEYATPSILSFRLVPWLEGRLMLRWGLGEHRVQWRVDLEGTEVLCRTLPSLMGPSPCHSSLHVRNTIKTLLSAINARPPPVSFFAVAYFERTVGLCLFHFSHFCLLPAIIIRLLPPVVIITPSGRLSAL